MKINLVSLSMFTGGIVLLYSGIKGYDPRDVIKWGMGGKKPKTLQAIHDDANTPKVPDEKTDPGQSHPGDKFYPPGTGDGGPTVPASDPSTGNVVSV